LIWRLSKQVATQLRQRGRVRGRIRFGVGSLAHQPGMAAPKCPYRKGEKDPKSPPTPKE
jgi:hypothetical protein